MREIRREVASTRDGMSRIVSGSASINLNLRYANGSVITTTTSPIPINTGNPVAVAEAAAAIPIVALSAEAAPDSSAPVRAGPALCHYVMSRVVKTVDDLWEEWHSGLAGGPSIKDLITIGNNWIRTGASKQFFYRRSRIIAKINEYAANNNINPETAKELAMRRQAGNKWSLDAMAKNPSIIFA